MENQKIETENFKQFDEVKVFSDLFGSFVEELSRKNDKTIELLIDHINRQSEIHQKTIETLAEVLKK